MKIKDRIKERSFINTLFTLTIIGIIFIITVIGVFHIYGEIERYRDTVEGYKRTVITQKKNLIKNTVNIILSYIDYERNEEKRKGKEKETKEEILAYLRQLRYGKGNYVFVLDKKGIMIMHPFRLQDIGKNVLDMKDPEGRYIAKEFLKAAKNPDGGYVEYIWEKPGTGKEAPKIGYAKLYKPWGWIIGTGVYLDDIENFIAIKKDKLRKRIKSDFTKLFILFSTLLFISIISLLWFKGQIRKNIDIFLDFFKKASSLHEKITLKNIKFKEFRVVAEYANKMVDDIKKEQRKLRRILDAIPDFIFIIDKNGKFVDWKGPEKLLFYPPEKFLGKNIKDVIPNFKKADELIESINKVLNDGKPRSITYSFKIRGNTHYFEARIIKLDNDKALVIERNITNKVLTERELMKINQVEALKNISGGLAHDFNNYLATILSNIELLLFKSQKGKLEKEELEEKLMTAKKVLDKATYITKELLALSKGGATNKRVTPIGKLVKEITLFNLQGSNIEPIFSIPDDLWDVDIDEGQFSRAIQNIVLNARDAMPKGGKIYIELKNRHIEGDPLIKEGDYVEITIKDEGNGIPDNILHKIFEPFFFTKKKGNGLGLSITYSIVKKHDGYIKVKSEEGNGTTFHIFIPKAKTQTRRVNNISKEEKEDKKMGEGKKKRILLMDDDEFIRDVVSDQISFLGHEIELAEDGKEAIELYKKRKEEGRPFDLIIMDLTVKGGMGGKEAMDEIRKFDKDVPIAVSTGYSDDDIVRNYKSYGFSGVLTKPFKMDELSKLIEELTEKD